jgi:hypothetical protein
LNDWFNHSFKLSIQRHVLSRLRRRLATSYGGLATVTVLFHRRVQHLRRQQDRELCRGKADLDRLLGEPLPVKLLEDLQIMLNAALAAE